MVKLLCNHSWDGCTCIKCGKIRDMKHTWNGCKCTTCETVRNIDHSWKYCKCEVCGKTRAKGHAWHEDGTCVFCGSLSDEKRWERRHYLLEKKTRRKLPFVCSGLGITVFCIGIAILILLMLQYSKPIYDEINYFTSTNIFIMILCSIVFGTLSPLFMYSYYISKRDRAEYEIKRKEAKEIAENIQVDFFDNLIKLSNNYLDQYYNQTKVQAEKSFMVSLGVSVFGAAVICFGIILLLFDKTSPAYVTTSAGVLSEFIAAVFFYFYNSTIKSMSRYHNKLVLSQNISIALKVADTLPDPIQGEVRSELIKQLVNKINKHIVMEEK